MNSSRQRPDAATCPEMGFFYSVVRRHNWHGQTNWRSEKVADRAETLGARGAFPRRLRPFLLAKLQGVHRAGLRIFRLQACSRSRASLCASRESWCRCHTLRPCQCVALPGGSLAVNRPGFSRRSRASESIAFQTLPARARCSNHADASRCRTSLCSRTRRPAHQPASDRSCA